MLVAGVRQRANHPTDLTVDLGDKCAEPLITQDGFQTLSHFARRCLVAELAHERRERYRIAQTDFSNCESHASRRVSRSRRGSSNAARAAQESLQPIHRQFACLFAPRFRDRPALRRAHRFQ